MKAIVPSIGGQPASLPERPLGEPTSCAGCASTPNANETTAATAYLERLARLVADSLDVPIAVVSLGPASTGTAVVAASGVDSDAIATAVRLCRDAASTQVELSLQHAGPPVLAWTVSAFAGNAYACLGSLAVFDPRRSTFTVGEIDRLRTFAALAGAYLALDGRAIAIEQQLTALSTASSSAIIFASRAGKIERWNDGASRLLGWRADETVGSDYALAPSDLQDEAARLRDLNLRHGQFFHDFETQRLTRDGLLLDVSLSAGPVRDAAGDIAGTVVIMDDRTQLNRLREAEKKRSAILELAANDAPLPQIFASLVESIEFSIVESICTILRCKGNALEHAASGRALPPVWIEAISQARIGPSEGSCGTAAYFGQTVIVDDIATDIRWETPRPLALELGLRACWSAPIFNSEGVVQGTLAVYSTRPRVPTNDQLRVMHDGARLASIAIEAQRSRKRLEDLALRDALTGLPNRAVFEDRLRHALEVAKRTGERVFVGLLDLDRFKLINDTLGHVVGDQLLVEVANRLRESARPQDTIARMGGDEFLFMLVGVESRENADAIARRILSGLDRSFSPSGNELFVHASLGFSSYPDDATDPTQLMRLADRVMYEVKARQTRVGFYERETEDCSLAKLPLEMALYRALDKGEFILHYEPQIGPGMCIEGAEAHLLWHNPERGVLSTEHFMGVADEVGLSASIGKWAFGEACRFAQRWKAAGGPGCVAVNVSARQFGSRDFVATVIDAIREAGIAPTQLSVELSEIVVGKSVEGVASTLAELRSFGIHAVLDDFGAGSSSMHNLTRLPIDRVKIGRSFFAEVCDGKKPAHDRAVMEAIVVLARASDLAVNVDGIESVAQLALVLASGCDVVQGALFAAAMPEQQFLQWSPAPGLASVCNEHWTAFNAEQDAIMRMRLELRNQTQAN